MTDQHDFDSDEQPMCRDSVGPRTYEEAVARGMHLSPFNFRPEDFEHRTERIVEENRPQPSL